MLTTINYHWFTEVFWRLILCDQQQLQSRISRFQAQPRSAQPVCRPRCLNPALLQQPHRLPWAFSLPVHRGVVDALHTTNRPVLVVVPCVFVAWLAAWRYAARPFPAAPFSDAVSDMLVPVICVARHETHLIRVLLLLFVPLLLHLLHTLLLSPPCLHARYERNTHDRGRRTSRYL